MNRVVYLLIYIVSSSISSLRPSACITTVVSSKISLTVTCFNHQGGLKLCFPGMSCQRVEYGIIRLIISANGECRFLVTAQVKRISLKGN